MKQYDVLVVFGSVQKVMRAERLARDNDIDVESIPAPRAVSSECGVVLEIDRNVASKLNDLLATIDLKPQAVYRKHNELWTPTTMLAVSDSHETRLTKNTNYGGCGAKLAKGTLEKILCGLPKLESTDLLVGIDYADDAGVVRVREDLAIIHTTDFFPPMVDDPFSFGRIAAANALSDVYAMGGDVLAAMNLVSFPLEEYDREILKQILHGGISALEECSGLLAGGHTVEGQELLYGLAVTGTVHPDQIWRNGGAQDSDLLVLTKPLGTGLVTTAAKAEMVDPTHLSAAIRWMATLNANAARVLKTIAPHAVTDITGFGLVGHCAEMAEASGLTIEINLNALPALPGALEAANTGFVPAGAGKNRESVSNVLDIKAGVDPLRIDLALDPQTSGGLLAAVDKDTAEDLVRRLPASAIIGRCISGEGGRVHLV